MTDSSDDQRRQGSSSDNGLAEGALPLEGGAQSLAVAPLGTTVFQQPPQQEFHCSICLDVLHAASSPTGCSHWFCEDCLKGHLETNEPTCPVCRQGCDPARVMAEHGVRSLVGQLRVYCRFGLVKGPGGVWQPSDAPGRCHEVMALEEVEAHERRCSCAVMECTFPGCRVVLLRSEVKGHNREATQRHLELAMAELRSTQEELRDTLAELRNTREELSSLRSGLPAMHEEHSGDAPELLAAAAGQEGSAPMGLNLFVSASRDRSLRIWDAESWDCKGILQTHSEVYSAAFFSDGQRIVSGSWEGNLMVWRVADGHCEATLEGHRGPVYSLAVLPDRHRIVSASYDGTLKAWRTADYECEATLQGHSHVVSAVSVLPDGQRIVSASWDGTLRVWRTADWQCDRVLRGHDSGVLALAVLPEGGQVVSASCDQTLKVWGTTDWQCQATLRGHNSPVFSVAVFPDGQSVVSVSQEGTIKVWRTADWQSRITLEQEVEDSAMTVTVLPSGRHMVSCCDDGALTVWRTADWEWERILEGHVGRVEAVAVL